MPRRKGVEPKAGDETGHSAKRPERARPEPLHLRTSTFSPAFPDSRFLLIREYDDGRKTQPLLTSSICMRTSELAVVEPQYSTYDLMLGVIPVNHHEGPSAEGPSDNSWATSNARYKKKRFQCPHCQRLFARLEHQQRHERTRECPIERPSASQQAQ
jgi:hypothetical protein